MAMTKQQLATRIWGMANKMRGNIKSANYKDYILGFLFYKFLSDKQQAFMDTEGIGTDDMQDEATLDYIRDRLGYVIRVWERSNTVTHHVEKGDLFSVWKAMGDNLTVKQVSEALYAFERDISPAQKNVFSKIFGTLQAGLADVGSTGGLRDKAVRDIIDAVGLVDASDDGYDVLAYIYEYLVKRFALTSKDDGEFYTPHEVSRLISMILADYFRKSGKTKLKAYDPTSGSGSLLRAVGYEAGRYIDPDMISYFGQEKITETYHLTRMNLVMQGVPAQNITIRNGDTLEDDWPYFDDKTPYSPLRVDAVVSNPPYSLKWRPEGRESDDRFRKYGLAPAGKADYAFLLHCLYHLEDDGMMGIVLPHGVLFRGDSEGQIRKNLILGHNIETIVGLPANLFFATGIPTILMFLRKDRAADDVLFIDASKSFMKAGTQNVLREQDIRRIFDAVRERTDIPGFAHLATRAEIEANGYNLNIPRYVDALEHMQAPDFAGLMTGRAPERDVMALDDYWAALPGLEQVLFEDCGDGYYGFRDCDEAALKAGHPGVMVFRDRLSKGLRGLNGGLRSCLIYDDYAGVDPEMIREDCEGLVMKFAEGMGVLDRYDAYQCFADMWPVIANDIEIMQKSGLAACRECVPNMVMKGDVEKQDGESGLVLGFDLIGRRFFQAEYDGMRKLVADAMSAESEAADLFEDLDEDVKAGCGGDKPKAGEIRKYMKDCDGGVKSALKDLSGLLDKAKALKKQAANAELAIDDKIKAQMAVLTDDEIKSLLEEKWCGGVLEKLGKLAEDAIGKPFKVYADLKAAYGTTLEDIQSDINDDGASLFGMLDILKGNDTAMAGIGILRGFLSGKRGGTYAG